MFKHGTDPASETLKGANLILWEDKMDQLYFGKAKWISSLEKSMKSAFKAYLGKNSSASSRLYDNKQNTYS